MDSLVSGLNWTRLLLVFTGTGLYLHLPGALLKTDGGKWRTQRDSEDGNQEIGRGARTEGQMKQESQ